MGYIEKLRDSIGREELDSLITREVADAIELPHFTFGEVTRYPKDDLEECIEAAYSGSPISMKVEELNETIRSLRASEDEYVAEIERIEGENRELKERVKELNVKPMARRGRPPKADQPDGIDKFLENEWYPYESYTFLKTMLVQWMQNHKPQTPTEDNRAYGIAKAYMEALDDAAGGEAPMAGKAFRKSIEDAVDEAYESNPTNIMPLVKLGFIDCTGKGSPHWKLTYKGMEGFTFTIAKTPSAPTSKENCKKAICQRLCI